MDRNTADAQACAPTKKSDVELLRENEEKIKFCPSDKDMRNAYTAFPHSHTCKRIQQSPDYMHMVMKPFERGVNFFTEGYLHDVVANHHVESQTFYLRALCYRSLRKSEPPHKRRLAISTKQPNFDLLGSSWTCVAGSLEFCNHALGLMYLVSHFFMTKIKVIPDSLASTSLPQQWHKPRRKTISSEPLMDMI